MKWALVVWWCLNPDQPCTVQKHYAPTEDACWQKVDRFEAWLKKDKPKGKIIYDCLRQEAG